MKRIYIIPNNDLEAKQMIEMTKERGLVEGRDFFVTNQKWGASYENLEPEIKEAIIEKQFDVDNSPNKDSRYDKVPSKNTVGQWSILVPNPYRGTYDNLTERDQTGSYEEYYEIFSKNPDKIARSFKWRDIEPKIYLNDDVEIVGIELQGNPNDILKGTEYENCQIINETIHKHQGFATDKENEHNIDQNKKGSWLHTEVKDKFFSHKQETELKEGTYEEYLADEGTVIRDHSPEEKLKSGNYKDVFLFEYETTETTTEPIKINGRNIDHHVYANDDRSNEKSSIEQLAEEFNHELSHYEKLVAANDKAYIPGIEAELKEQGCPDDIIEDMIQRIRQEDRAAQGITSFQEHEAEFAISQTMQITDNDLYIVTMDHSKTSTVTDRLYGCYDNLLIITYDTDTADTRDAVSYVNEKNYTTNELNFFGSGEICKQLQQEYGGWSGGDLETSGFWGLSGDITPELRDEITNFIDNAIELQRDELEESIDDLEEDDFNR